MNSKAIRNALAVVLAGASIAAHAQVDPARTPVKTAPAATPAPAPAPVAVTSEMRAAIKEMLDVMNTKENLAKTFQAMSQTLPPQMAQAMNRQIEANATLTPEQKTRVREGMNQPFDNAVKEAAAMINNPKLVDDTIDKMYPIYAKYYSVADIRAITAFYKSPVGAKTLTTMPQAINESLQAGVAGFQPRVNALMEKTVKTQVDAVTSGAAASAPAPASGPAPAPAPAKK